MADAKQLRIVKSGIEEWNRWRSEHPDVVAPDLSRADLSQANLNDANFDNVNLAHANLRGATLFNANLTRANLLKAELTDAVLYGCDLSSGNLVQANFTAAFLTGANLSNADMTSAKFVDANLSRANLNGATLRDTDFDSCGMEFTVLTNVNLSHARNLHTAKHRGPSSIGIDTIYLSEGNIPEEFMREAGIPEPFVAHAKSLVAAMTPVQFYSCFISYSHKDREFAQILYSRLQRAGIRCWLDEHQLLPGDDIYHQVDRAIRLWDKLLLCCTEHSLKSWWVDHEVGTAFEKEQQLTKERGYKVEVLVPLNLDNYLFKGWQSGYAAQVRRRLAADFVGIQSTPQKFDQQIDKLVRALRADEKARESAPASRL